MKYHSIQFDTVYGRDGLWRVYTTSDHPWIEDTTFAGVVSKFEWWIGAREKQGRDARQDEMRLKTWDN